MPDFLAVTQRGRGLRTQSFAEFQLQAQGPPLPVLAKSSPTQPGVRVQQGHKNVGHRGPNASSDSTAHSSHLRLPVCAGMCSPCTCKEVCSCRPWMCAHPHLGMYSAHTSEFIHRRVCVEAQHRTRVHVWVCASQDCLCTSVCSPTLETRMSDNEPVCLSGCVQT